MTHWITVGVGLLVVYAGLCWLWFRQLSDVPNLSNKKIQAAMSSRLILHFFLASFVVWSNVHYKLPDNILQLRWVYIVVLAVVVGLDFAVQGFLRWKFPPPENLTGQASR